MLTSRGAALAPGVIGGVAARRARVAGRDEGDDEDARRRRPMRSGRACRHDAGDGARPHAGEIALDTAARAGRVRAPRRWHGERGRAARTAAAATGDGNRRVTSHPRRSSTPSA